MVVRHFFSLSHTHTLTHAHTHTTHTHTRTHTHTHVIFYLNRDWSQIMDLWFKEVVPKFSHANLTKLPEFPSLHINFRVYIFLLFMVM